MPSKLSRRLFVCAAPLALAACASNQNRSMALPGKAPVHVPEFYRQMYAAVDTEPEYIDGEVEPETTNADEAAAS